MGSGIKKDTTKPSSLEHSSLILADELHKPVIKKFNKRKVYSQFKDNIWGVDLADMQSLSRKNKGIKYFLCAIDLYSKYDVLDDIVNEYNNTKHNTIKMKPKDVGNNNKRVYIDEYNEKRSRFKVGD